MNAVIDQVMLTEFSIKHICCIIIQKDVYCNYILVHCCSISETIVNR